MAVTTPHPHPHRAPATALRERFPLLGGRRPRQALPARPALPCSNVHLLDAALDGGGGPPLSPRLGVGAIGRWTLVAADGTELGRAPTREEAIRIMGWLALRHDLDLPVRLYDPQAKATGDRLG